MDVSLDTIDRALEYFTPRKCAGCAEMADPVYLGITPDGNYRFANRWCISCCEAHTDTNVALLVNYMPTSTTTTPNRPRNHILWIFFYWISFLWIVLTMDMGTPRPNIVKRAIREDKICKHCSMTSDTLYLGCRRNIEYEFVDVYCISCFASLWPNARCILATNYLPTSMTTTP